jgi:phosphoenolpyruvate-protein kinase (PTS system EI component)
MLLLGAACMATKERIPILPYIIIPFVSSHHELLEIIPVIKQAAEEAFTQHGLVVEYGIGVQVEVPRACMKARDIAAVDGID